VVSVVKAKADAVTAPTYPTPNPSAHPELTPMLAMVTASEIKSYVNQLSTAYATRYYRATNARGEFQTMMTFLKFQLTLFSLLPN
jgi:hypothetical protein